MKTKTKEKMWRVWRSADVQLAVGTVALSVAAVAAVVYAAHEAPVALAGLLVGAAVGLPALFRAVGNS
mgnify:CR=1 FL=1